MIFQLRFSRIVFTRFKNRAETTSIGIIDQFTIQVSIHHIGKRIFPIEKTYWINARRASDKAWQSSNDSPSSLTLSGSGQRLPMANATTQPASRCATIIDHPIFPDFPISRTNFV